MSTVVQDLRQPRLRDVRCECTVCGAHAMGWLGRSLSACCGNCGSYELRVLTTRMSGLAAEVLA